MFGAIFRFIVTWIPFLRRLFPDTAFKDQRKDEGTTDRLPRSRIAIIGSGVGGGFAAYFLREFGPELDIHMWRKKGSKVGGRTAVVEFDGHVYESGASVIHTSNKYLVDLAKKFGKFCRLVMVTQIMDQLLYSYHIVYWHNLINRSPAIPHVEWRVDGNLDTMLPF